MAIETVTERYGRVKAEYDTLSKLKNPTKEQIRKRRALFDSWEKLGKKIEQAQLVTKKNRGTLEKSNAAAAKRAAKRAEDTPPPVTISGADESGQGKQASGEAPLDHASKKAKERDAADKKRKEAEEKEKARIAENIASLTPKPKQTAAQKNAAKGTSGEGPYIPKATSRDTLGETVKSAKAKQEKKAADKRRADATGVDPAPSKISTYGYQGKNGSSTKKSTSTSKSSGKSILADAGEAATGLVSGIAKGLKNLVSGDFKLGEKPDGYTQEEYESSDPRAMNRDVRDLKKGGKVTKKKKKASYGKKYSMNRGGKVASLRKPTRA
jgi:hypothetical protein